MNAQTSNTAGVLNIWINHQLIGELRTEHDIWSFVYDDNWLNSQDSFSLSPSFSRDEKTHTDTSNYRPVQWFFDNLLPEETARDLLAKDSGIKKDQVFELLKRYGAESAGAITLLPLGINNEIDIKNSLITAENMSQRVQALPKQSLAFNAPKKMSLAGAQHKLAINYDAKGKQLYEPGAKSLSTHIVKPDHTDTANYYHTVVNEWFCMRLAKEVGLDVPLVYLHFTPEPLYIIERFDRLFDNNVVVGRRHSIDACQYLGLSRASKYDDANADTLRRLIDSTGKKAKHRKALLEWVIFNLLIGNDDAHLKNISLFAGLNESELTPFYDLLCTSIYNNPSPLSVKLPYQLGTATVFDDVTNESIKAFAQSIGIAPKAVASVIVKLTQNCVKAGDKIYKEFEQMPCPEHYGPAKAGALRMLREIKYNVMKPMMAKITL